VPGIGRLSFMLPLVCALGVGRRRNFMETFPYGIKSERIRSWIVGSMLAGDSGAAGLAGNPWPSLAEFVRLSGHVRRRLPRVRAPCLVVHSTDDDIASLRNVAVVEKHVRAPVETVLLDDSYHMVSVDQQRDILIARSVQFFKRIASSTPSTPSLAP
ncbi:MAG TPA: alpha/beta hydrolase, partial [Caldimonas sp.]